MTTPATARAEPAVQTAPSERGGSVSQAGEPRDLRIESIRALAALGVVAAHAYLFSGGVFLAGVRGHLVFGARLSVWVLIVLSGYLMYLPFARRDFGGGQSIDLSQYAANRVLRVFPLYYVALIVVLVVVEGGASPRDWLFYGLFMQDFSSSTINAINPPVWTIPVEIQFYVLLPAMAWGLARLGRRSLRPPLIALALLALASMVVRTYSLDPSPDQAHLRELLRFSLPSLAYLFVVGLVVAMIKTRWAGQRPGWIRGPLARSELWLLAAVPLWLVMSWTPRLEPLTAGPACFLVLGAIVLPLESGRLLRVLDLKLLGIIGLASYSLYIWHVPLLDVLTDGGDNAIAASFGTVLLVGVPAACLFAVVSYRLVEVPGLRLRKRWGSTGWSSKASGPETKQQAVAAVADAPPEPRPATR